MDFQEYEIEYRKKKEKQDLELSLMKAKTAIIELNAKLDEKSYDMKRIEHHITLQEKVVLEAENKLNNLE